MGGTIDDFVEFFGAESIVSVLVVAYLILSVLRNWNGTPLEKRIEITLDGLTARLDKQIDHVNNMTQQLFDLNKELVSDLRKGARARTISPR